MLTVAIAGVSLLRLSILERLVPKVFSGSVRDEVNILLFDPDSSGRRCHDLMQHQRLPVNTVTSQMTIFGDVVLVVTGHDYDRKNGTSFICYPIDRAISGITNSSTVAIKGPGLRFIGVITLLTSGRGGNFIRKNGKIKYTVR